MPRPVYLELRAAKTVIGHKEVSRSAERGIDLIVRAAHARRKDALRVIRALALVAEEYQLDPSDVLSMPIDSSRPNLQQKRRCETAYLSLYGNDEYQRSLFEIEQLV